jgi:hypothetical protein
MAIPAKPGPGSGRPDLSLPGSLPLMWATIPSATADPAGRGPMA